MGEKGGVENQEGYHSLWEMLQGPIHFTVQAQSLADIQKHDGLLTYSGLVILDSVAGFMK